jgi:adenylate kinase
VRVGVTGTPGTGKTTVTERLDTDLQVVHLNELIRERGLHRDRDETRDSVVADMDAVRKHLPEGDAIVESHLAHHLPADRVVVLRCHPEELTERLAERDESAASVAENAEAERLDVVLTEAVERHGRDAVYEIDTTGRAPEAVVADVAAVLAGERDPEVGVVSFLTDDT